MAELEYKNLEYKSKMTIEQAIEILTMLDVCGLAYEAKEIAIEALKKQIPQKVLAKNWYDNEIHVCPVCENLVLHDYCPFCGQKLNWSDDYEVAE